MSESEADRAFDVPAADFAAVDWQVPLAAARKVDPRDIADLYRALLPQDREQTRATPAGRVHRLLFDLCGIMLRPGDRGEVWAPVLVFNGQGRSAIPADYSTAQWDVLAALAPSVVNPGLRARLADLVWSADRRLRAMAELAVEAYCQMIEGLLDGTYDSHLQRSEPVDFDDIAWAMRALSISAATQKGKSPSERPKAIALKLYALAKDAKTFVAFIEAAKIVLRYGLLDPDVVGADAEAVAAPPTPETHEMAVQGLWLFAAEAWRHAKRPDDERRCQLKAVDFTLARAGKAPSALVASHFLRAAIGELRAIPDTYDQRVALERKLRDRQREGVGEFRGPQIRTDLTDLAHLHLEGFESLSLSAALRQFALIHQPKAPDALEAEARESLRKFPLANLFAVQHHDAEGKVVAGAPGGGIGDEPDPAQLKSKIDEQAGHFRNIAANGAIEPVRAMMGRVYDVNEADLWPIVSLSPFVPPDHAALFALGFTRFFQGDLMSAAHILLPQIEPGLRHLLLSSGEEPSLLQSDLMQEDRSLSRMLEHDRAALEGILGPALTLAVDQIFNLKPPGLRHAMAHGLISARGCFGPEPLFAMWFLYHMTCLPLIDDWAEHVEGAIRTAGWSPAMQDETAEGAPKTGLELDV